MKTNWTIALAAILFILGCAPAKTKPTQWRDVYRNNQGWQSVATDSNGNKVVVTAKEQNKAATAVVTTYNRDGSVKGSFSQRLPRR